MVKSVIALMRLQQTKTSSDTENVSESDQNASSNDTQNFHLTEGTRILLKHTGLFKKLDDVSGH
jgi:hypothetical protein